MVSSSLNRCELHPCPPPKGECSSILQSCSLVLLLYKLYPKVGILSVFVPRHHLNNNAANTAYEDLGALVHTLWFGRDLERNM